MNTVTGGIIRPVDHRTRNCSTGGERKIDFIMLLLCRKTAVKYLMKRLFQNCTKSDLFTNAKILSSLTI